MYGYIVIHLMKGEWMKDTEAGHNFTFCLLPTVYFSQNSNSDLNLNLNSNSNCNNYFDNKVQVACILNRREIELHWFIEQKLPVKAFVTQWFIESYKSSCII